MKNILAKCLILLGKIYIICLLLGAAVLTIPIYLLWEFLNYMDQVNKVRSNRALTDYID